MENIEDIKVISIKPVANCGALKAFVNVEVGSQIIPDCLIIQGRFKPWVLLPAQSNEKGKGNMDFETILESLNRRVNHNITQAVLKAWDDYVGDTNEFK